MKKLIDKLIIKYLLKHGTVLKAEGKVVRVFSESFDDKVVRPALDFEWASRNGVNCRHTFKPIF